MFYTKLLIVVSFGVWMKVEGREGEKTFSFSSMLFSINSLTVIV